ncbi:MAG: class I SAM-dependent methyltransferase [Chloroflexi bacterium]|nr:class I SAM-dependent methyltransferase [Chloroflexota bacterium]MBV9600610.1 class I SAM-dependent methyltransferase [Chloroflexota bacterium]
MADPSAKLATAHENWNERWKDATSRAAWQAPEPLVQALADRMRERGLSRVLDVGCGIGRHAHYLATQGFACVGVDASESGLAYAREQASGSRVRVDYRVGTFYDLAFPDLSFDAVVAWNVLYHGDGEVARRAIDGIERVLAPGGLYVGTMLSRRNVQYGRGREVAADTFVVDGDPGDKGHPHFYCSTATLIGLHRGFEVLDLRDRAQTPGAFHWEFTMERPASTRC